MDRLRKRRILFRTCVALLILIGLALLGLEWDVYRTENRVWKQGDVSGLKDRASLYEWASEGRLTRPGLKGRLVGLLADLRHSEAKYEESHALYQISLNRFADTLSGGDPLALLSSRSPEHSNFVQGFRSHEMEPFSAPPLDDGDLLLVRFELPDRRNARYDLERIPSVDEQDQPAIRDLFLGLGEWSGEDEDAVATLTETYRDSLRQLSALGDEFALNEEGDLEPLTLAIDLARLAGIDSFYQAEAGNLDLSRASLNTAYRLIGYAEQSPGLVSALMVVALREPLVEAMSGPGGEAVASFFSKDQAIAPHFFETAIRGEYTSMNRILESTYSPDSSSRDQRVIQAARLSRIVFWKSALEGEQPRVDHDEEMSRWYFHNRRYFYRRNLRSHAEGKVFSAAIEEWQAFTFFWPAAPNIGPLKESLEEIRIREQTLLRKSEK